jgi:hypothetical protein
MWPKARKRKQKILLFFFYANFNPPLTRVCIRRLFTNSLYVLTSSFIHCFVFHFTVLTSVLNVTNANTWNGNVAWRLLHQLFVLVLQMPKHSCNVGRLRIAELVQKTGLFSCGPTRLSSYLATFLPLYGNCKETQTSAKL